jgi:hypothetical protein
VSLRRSGPGRPEPVSRNALHPLPWRFSGVCADRVPVGRSRGFDASCLTPVRGCGYRSRATRRETPERLPGRNWTCTSSPQSVGGPRARETEQLPPTSAPMPTPVQHSCRPTSAPMLNRYILFIVLSLLLSSIYLRGTPRCPIPLPDRSPPPSQLASVRDFRPLIPAHGDRRLHGRLDGRSPVLALEKPSPAKGFSKPCRHRSARATRSKGYASGPRVDVCRQTGRGCIRGRKERVADG